MACAAPSMITTETWLSVCEATSRTRWGGGINGSRTPSTARVGMRRARLLRVAVPDYIRFGVLRQRPEELPGAPDPEPDVVRHRDPQQARRLSDAVPSQLSDRPGQRLIL